tara:strand:+ start:3633 stop:4973 length:1341 start_codon:yes stop_codon:yes gene_type:complete
MIFYKGGIAKDRESIRNLRNAQATSLQATADSRNQQNIQNQIKLIVDKNDEMLEAAKQNVIPIIERIKDLKRQPVPVDSKEKHQKLINDLETKVTDVIGAVQRQTAMTSQMLGMLNLGGSGMSIPNTLNANLSTFVDDINRFGQSDDRNFVSSKQARKIQQTGMLEGEKEYQKKTAGYNAILDAALPPTATAEQRRAYIRLLEENKRQFDGALDPGHFAVKAFNKQLEDAESIISSQRQQTLFELADLLSNPDLKTGILPSLLGPLQNILESLNPDSTVVLKNRFGNLELKERFAALTNLTVLEAFRFVKGNLNQKEVALVIGTAPGEKGTVDGNIGILAGMMAMADRKRRFAQDAYSLMVDKGRYTERDVAEFLKARSSKEFSLQERKDFIIARDNYIKQMKEGRLGQQQKAENVITPEATQNIGGNNQPPTVLNFNVETPSGTQ